MRTTRWRGRLVTGLLAASAFLFASGGALARPLYLFGSVGNSPVLLMVEREKNTLSGRYLYLREAREIRIEGSIDARNGFEFDELDGARRIATFAGRIDKDKWTGTWRRIRGGDTLDFAARESRDTLATLDTALSCSTKTFDRESGYTFAETIDLRVAKGKVSKLSLSHTANGNGDEQSCSLALSDLQSLPSDAGILLHSKPGAGDLNQRCSVRIVSDGQYFLVQLGDASEPNNDCHGGNDAMFCSARGGWTDMVIARKPNVCRQIE